MYSVVEIFTSLQGEGQFVGYPVNFVRLAGCSMGCKFCDTDLKEREVLTAAEILPRLKPQFSRTVVLTGGEPLEQDCRDIVVALHDAGYKIHLETNGTQPIPRGWFEWVSMSPKPKEAPGVGNYLRANEIKWLVPLWSFEDIMYWVHQLFGAEHYVQPVNNRLSINRKALTTALSYIERADGRLSLSIQQHKLLKIR